VADTRLAPHALPPLQSCPPPTALGHSRHCTRALSSHRALTHALPPLQSCTLCSQASHTGDAPTQRHHPPHHACPLLTDGVCTAYDCGCPLLTDGVCTACTGGGSIGVGGVILHANGIHMCQAHTTHTASASHTHGLNTPSTRPQQAKHMDVAHRPSPTCTCARISHTPFTACPLHTDDRSARALSVPSSHCALFSLTITATATATACGM
jgi:hypothetical protein